MISTNIGNVMDRSGNEYYISEAMIADAAYTVTGATFEGDVPPKTSVEITVRVNGGEWVKPEQVALNKGDTLEYRVNLYAYNCLRTPRITKITVEME